MICTVHCLKLSIIPLLPSITYDDKRTVHLYSRTTYKTFPITIFSRERKAGWYRGIRARVLSFPHQSRKASWRRKCLSQRRGQLQVRRAPSHNEFGSLNQREVSGCLLIPVWGWGKVHTAQGIPYYPMLQISPTLQASREEVAERPVSFAKKGEPRLQFRDTQVQTLPS